MAIDRNTSNSQQPSYERPPKKSLTPWVLLLPLILLAGVLWQLRREPEPQPVNQFVSNSAAPPGPRLKPTTAPTAPKTAATKIKVPDKLTVFVPDDNAVLQRQVVDNPFDEYLGSGDQYEMVAGMSLNMLTRKAPDLFPQGSFIGSVQREGNLVKVNLSKKWYAMPQWNQGSSFAMLAQDSIVNTLAAADAGKSGAIKVQFLQDGKPAQLLGELDMSEPLSPSKDLVAGS